MDFISDILDLDKEFLGKTIAIIVLCIFSFIYIEYKKIISCLEKLIDKILRERTSVNVEDKSDYKPKSKYRNDTKTPRLIFASLFLSVIIPIITKTNFCNLSWRKVSFEADADLRNALLAAMGSVIVILTFIETRRKNIDDAFRDRKLKGLELLGSENSRARLIGFDVLSVLIDEKIKEDDKQEAQQILNNICNNISMSSRKNMEYTSSEEGISKKEDPFAYVLMIENIRRHYYKEEEYIRYNKTPWNELSLEFIGGNFEGNLGFKGIKVYGDLIFRTCIFDKVLLAEAEINKLHFVDCSFGVGSISNNGKKEEVLNLNKATIKKSLRLERYKNINRNEANFEDIVFSEGCEEPELSLGKEDGIYAGKEFDRSSIDRAYEARKNKTHNDSLQGNMDKLCKLFTKILPFRLQKNNPSNTINRPSNEYSSTSVDDYYTELNNNENIPYKPVSKSHGVTQGSRQPRSQNAQGKSIAAKSQQLSVNTSNQEKSMALGDGYDEENSVNEQDKKTKRANVTRQPNVPRRGGRQRGGGTLS